MGHTRAALYLRQSVDREEGIERQRARTRALAEARRWEVVATFRDNDVSASKPRGPKTEWGRMLAALDRGEFDVVVAVDLDRLLRTTRDLNTLIDHGAKVVTVDGEIDLSTADGEFRATMLAGIARFEGQRKAERMKRANEARAKAGRWVGGRRPFGFESDGVTVREGEADAIVRAFDDVVAGVPLGAIARRWNEAGLTPGQSRQPRSGHAGEPSSWRHDNVRAVLTNPRYVGWVRHNGEIVSRKAVWPALVDESTYLAVQGLLADPARRSGVPGGRRLLSGIALCGVEGCGATVHAGGAFRRGIANYRCSGSTGHFARMAEPVEDFVSRVIVARLSQEDARDLLTAQTGADARKLRREATALRSRIDDLASLLADGTLTATAVRAQSALLRERVAAIEATLAGSARVDVLGPLVGVNDVQAVWDALGVERQRLVVATLMQVTIHGPGRGSRIFRPETVKIAWRTEREAS